ncbi:DNA polymerase Y family protein [Roseomonas sp. KE2513]|uniref:Y-family DNA polymerase n=1 Tax=Roseomonas sp. KE2513 TaxID=2479202 RepID=UPI0018DF138B|nr:DNA polymerase Y family protein [Roseomonas sp. KE2513]MBI0536923.1 DNA polymerase Y family protein [Roseomonas sp. KE2513]
MRGDSGTARRFVAVHLPWLAVDALRRREPSLAGQAIATWQAVGNRRTLICVDAPHLHAGQALADAQAMLPDLVLRPAEPAGEAELLQRLGHWALRFTPIVALDAPDGLILDVTGCTDLFGGELSILAEVESCFRRASYRARVGMAGNADAAAALVRAGHNGVVVPVGGDLAAIGALPVTTLRLPGEIASGLARLGLLTLGDVLRQPRAPLTRRFGRPLLDALDFASGARARPLTLVQPPVALLAIRSFLEPIVTRPAIDRAVDALLDELCAVLEEAGRGARRLSLLAFRVDSDVQEVAIGVGSPSRDAAHLRRLFAEPLGTLEPDLGFERMILRATETNALGARQLSGLGGAGQAGEQERMLSKLIDRLSQHAVLWRAAPTGSHWPEDSFAPVDPYAVPEITDGWEERRRPVRLLPQPKELAVVAEVPDGPPARLRLDGQVHRVRHAAGPERLEPEWWGDKHDRPRRDYFRVETEEGSRLWVCRLGIDRPSAPARWFLHGVMA